MCPTFAEDIHPQSPPNSGEASHIRARFVEMAKILMEQTLREKQKKSPCLQGLSSSDAGCHGMSNGGAEGVRTPDLMSARHALSQLSYSPEKTWVSSLGKEGALV